jgi:hypothetical protein
MFLMMKPTHSSSNTRFDISVIFMSIYSLSDGDISINLGDDDFVKNLKINQSNFSELLIYK